VLVNTNGVRLANDTDFAKELNRRYQRGGLHLQFDGAREAGSAGRLGGSPDTTRIGEKNDGHGRITAKHEGTPAACFVGVSASDISCGQCGQVGWGWDR